MQCQGCITPIEQCAGEVRKYNVQGGAEHPIRDWGTFWYCDRAAEEDRERGFTVTPATLASLLDPEAR